MKHVAFPFLTLGDDQVEAAPWCGFDEDGSIAPVTDHIAGWDHARELRLTRSLGLPTGPVGTRLGMADEEVGLEVVVRAGTGPGSMPRRTWILFRGPLRAGMTALIDHTVPGEGLSHRLRLETSILLVRPNLGTSRFAPRRPGSILWRDEIEIILEGESPRFPMEIVSFRERFSGRAESTSLWHLHWRPGHMHRDFGGSVRLFLNHDRQDFIDRFVGSDPLTLQCTLADVITQILGHALQDDDLEEILADSEPTSVAGHVSTWLDLAFPGQDIAAVRNLRRTSPGLFHSAILAMADPQILGGGA